MPRKILEGSVVNDKSDKTVYVLVKRFVKHAMYKKYVRKFKKYAAHDENNQFKIGDVVRIEESRPISKRKCWVVISKAGEDGGAIGREKCVSGGRL